MSPPFENNNINSNTEDIIVHYYSRLLVFPLYLCRRYIL
jgi:hypothetical protein